MEKYEWVTDENDAVEVKNARSAHTQYARRLTHKSSESK